MGISGISNNQIYLQSYKSTSQYNKQISNNINHFTGASTSNLTLHIGSDDSDKAVSAVAYPNGVSLSVYNSGDSDSDYQVKYWDENGKKQETTVNAKEVDSENASYLEMLAYSAYCNHMGYASNASGDFLLASGGVNADLTYDSSNLTIKANYKSLVQDFMNLQYKSNNYQGYLTIKQYYDYMNDNSSYS